MPQPAQVCSPLLQPACRGRPFQHTMLPGTPLDLVFQLGSVSEADHFYRPVCSAANKALTAAKGFFFSLLFICLFVFNKVMILSLQSFCAVTLFGC